MSRKTLRDSLHYEKVKLVKPKKPKNESKSALKKYDYKLSRYNLKKKRQEKALAYQKWFYTRPLQEPRFPLGATGNNSVSQWVYDHEKWERKMKSRGYEIKNYKEVLKSLGISFDI